jgi:hypothetical protein
VPRRALRCGAGGRLLTLSVVRHQWEEGARRLAAEQSDPVRYRALAALVDVVADELRRKVGQTFTLAELADAYQGAEDWVRDVVVAASSARDPEAPAAGGRPAGLRDAALVQDAAFAQYARGATDYRP